MTTPNFEYDCYHCGQRCGGRLPTGYGAVVVEDGSLHAACHPDDPAGHPDCYMRIMQHFEVPGALRGVDPLPAGVDDIRR